MAFIRNYEVGLLVAPQFLQLPAAVDDRIERTIVGPATPKKEEISINELVPNHYWTQMRLRVEALRSES
jgi:hypothetical protein